MERIVVGVDGSDNSLAALQWAVAEARRRGAHLQVVRSWTWSSPVAEGLLTVPGDLPDQVEAAVTAELQQQLERVDTNDVDVEPMIAYGSAASVLTELAQGADLLVVGSRGRGGFKGLLLGSVSQQCAQHAPCPVVIVPPGAR